MIRILRIVIVLALLVAGGIWFANHPGRLSLTWLGWQVDTSVAFFLLALGAILAALWGLWKLLVGVILAPKTVWSLGRRSRRNKGLSMLTAGLAASAAGEGAEALKLARRSRNILGDSALGNLLTAQASRQTGHKEDARRRFEHMLAIPETAFFGLRGLVDLSRDDDDLDGALHYARQAVKLKSHSPWALNTLFDLQVRTGHWADARETLALGRKRKIFEGAAELQALLLYQEGYAALADGQTLEAERLWQQAHDADAGFLPAATALARLQEGLGNKRKAAGVLERAWREAPHPDLAARYFALWENKSPADRYGQIEHLVHHNRDHPESRMALASAALATARYADGRDLLAPLTGNRPEARVTRLMARLYEAEGHDPQATRDWLLMDTRPDPAWTCDECGTQVDHWVPFCPHCQSFNSLTWRSAEVTLGGDENGTAADSDESPEVLRGPDAA